MKKTLALVLALVMVIGLMAVPVKADFTDSSSIEYNEAVDVLSATGVINGFENGSFDPAGNLTREQAAKIVAYLMLGEDNADALVATSAPFADVAADRWSAGYIAYCVNEGIINGRDANTFDPTGKVTGYEFAKLLLGCLGYSSKIEQYVGASWAINVAKTALDIDLFDGNSGANYNAPMTREEAALYSFNTLKATLVDYESQGTSIDLGNGVIISTGASKAEDVTVSKDTATIAGTLNAAGTVQFAEKYFEDLELDDTDTDDYGRPASSWIFDDDDVGTYSEEADFTYTADTKASVIEKDLKDYTITDTDADDDGTADDSQTFKVQTDVAGGYTADVVNDNDSSATALSVAANKSAGDAIADLTDKGRLVEVYTDGKAITNIVLIDTYVGEITTWKAEKDGNDEYVMVSELGLSPLTTITKFETAAFAQEDADDNTVVLYTYAEGEIQSIVAAESVSGVVSQSTGTSFAVGGTTYKYAVNSQGTASYVEDSEDETTVYLDNYGYAIYTKNEAADDVNYAYLVDIAAEGNWTSEKDYFAKLVLESGEEVTVELKKASYELVDDYFDGNIAVVDSNLLVTYTKDSKDVYTLGTTVKTVGAQATAGNDLAIDDGVAAITVGGAPYTANSKTVFIVAEKDGTDVEYTSYTGIKNVPSIDEDEDNDDTYAACFATASGIAKFVYVYEAEVDSSISVDEIIFVHAATVSGETKNAEYPDGYYTVKGYVNGVEDEFTTDFDVTEDVIAFGYSTDDDLIDLFDVTATDYVIALKDAVGFVPADLDYVDGNIEIDDGTPAYIAVDDDAKLYYVNDADETVLGGNIETLNETSADFSYVTYKGAIVAIFVYEA